MSVIQREYRRLLDSRMARNASWMFAGQGMGFVLQAVYFIILARLLGKVEYGIYAGAFAFTSLVAPYSALGTGTIFLRYVSGAPKAFAVYWGNILLVTLSIGTLFTLALYLIGPHFLNRESAELVLAAALSNCLFSALTAETARVFQAFDNMRTFATLSLLTNLLRTAAATCMLIMLHRATAWEWAIASTIVSGIGSVIAMATVSISVGAPKFSVQSVVKHGAEGVGYSFAASTTVVYNDFDKTLLSHYGMNAANGVYTMAYRILDIATMPINSIQGAAVPELFRRGRNGLGATLHLTRRLYKRGIPVALLAVVGLFLFAPIVPHIVGRQFIESVAVLRWLCLIPLFRAGHQLSGAALTGAGLQRFRTASQVVVSCLNAGSNFYLIPHFGWRGAAWSSLLADGLLAVFNLILLKTLSRSKYA